MFQLRLASGKEPPCADRLIGMFNRTTTTPRIKPRSAPQRRKVRVGHHTSLPHGSRRAAAPCAARKTGFTLLEVLVALIIALIAGVAFLQTVGSSMRATASTVAYDEAMVRAESHLAAATRSGALRPGLWQGDDGGGYQWRLRIVPLQVTQLRETAPTPAPTKDQPAPPSVALYRVVSQITWRDGIAPRVVTLATEQVGAP